MREIKSQEEFYFEVIRSLIAFSIEGLEIDSYEIKRPLKEVPTDTGWVERKPTGWKELKIVLKPKQKKEEQKGG